MNKKPLHPAVRLVTCGILSFVLLGALGFIGRDERWCIPLGGLAGAAILLVIPVLVRGDSWQKMIAGALLFVPSWALLWSVVVAASRL